jgi:hypothetical protein
MTERAAPFQCPYCGDEDLRPFGDGHGDWRCGACTRAFRLRYLGLTGRSDAGEWETIPAPEPVESVSSREGTAP